MGISNMVNFRKSAGDLPLTHFSTVQGNFVSFCRGNKACLAINKNLFPMEFKMQTDLPEGQYCDIAQSDSAECPFVTVGHGGDVKISVPRLSAVAFHIGKRPAQTTEAAFPEIYVPVLGGLSGLLVLILVLMFIIKYLGKDSSPKAGYSQKLLPGSSNDGKLMGA